MIIVYYPLYDYLHEFLKALWLTCRKTRKNCLLPLFCHQTVFILVIADFPYGES
ncbi:MAG TPA: hypothetical protein PKJ69_02460 [Spirochaetota bacterium]|nr:hypothetical protein [Spirochaetota bacterium]